jgi:hypothetical protein
MYKTKTVNINGKSVTLTNEVPQREGKFLILSNLYINSINLVTIVKIPEKYNGGMKFGDYYGVLEWGNKNVLRFDDKYFAEISLTNS